MLPTASNRMCANIPTTYPLYLPQELWDKITAYLPLSSALSAADIFKFKSSAYDRVWTAVFKNEAWLTSHSAKDVNIVLIGTSLDILGGITISKAQPHLVLAAFDRRGELQYENDLLRLSLRGDTSGLREHQLEQLILTITRLDVPEVLGQDFHYLFSSRDQDIETKYCFWSDPEKRIRTLCSQDIRGIGGPITHFPNLRPIFLLNLNPPTQILPDSECPSSDPVQFIFRCFGGDSFWAGCPPLVDVVLSEGWEQSQWEYTFESFTFKDGRYGKYNRQHTDWISVAESETRQECAIIRAL